MKGAIGKLLSGFRNEKYLITLLAAFMVGSPAYAQGQELGRLFFTPQQRDDLDRRRATNAQAVAATVTVEDRVTVNGRVTRSGGPSTTWINGQPQENLPRSTNPTVVTLPQGENQPSVSLKVGETMDRVKGERQDGLGGGTVSVTRGRN